MKSFRKCYKIGIFHFGHKLHIFWKRIVDWLSNQEQSKFAKIDVASTGSQQKHGVTFIRLCCSHLYKLLLILETKKVLRKHSENYF